MTSRPEPAAELTAFVGKRRGLCVRFHWIEDRYQHVIEGITRDGVTPLLESIEGNGQDDWPPSPAFQHLQVASVVGDHTIMLTGAAGTSYWSMSISVEQLPVDHDEAQSERATTTPGTYLLFDVACRSNSPPARLGSNYQVLDDTPSDQLRSMVFASGCFIVPPKLLDPARFSETQSCLVNAARMDGKKHVQISPSRELHLEPPATVRWCYGMFWGMI